MTVQIIETLKTETSTHVRALCGNTSGVVSVMSYGIQVVCENAAHKCWRGAGKFFPTIEKALANYKSGEMRSIITASVEIANGTK